jgi:hypothetical protein
LTAFIKNAMPQLDLEGNPIPQQAPNIEAVIFAIRQALDTAGQMPIVLDTPDAPVPQQPQSPQPKAAPDGQRSAVQTQSAQAVPTDGANSAKNSSTIRSAEFPIPGRLGNLAALRGENEALALNALKSETATNGLMGLQDAKLTQNQAPGQLRQWSGWLPVQFGEQKSAAWIQFEWKKPEGQGGGQQDAPAPIKPIPVSLALHLKSERLGWIGFHLSWAPPELNGSMVVENASVANLASGELRSLERQLSSDETPLVHVEVQRKVELTLG